jgi:hypothetical protein
MNAIVMERSRDSLQRFKAEPVAERFWLQVERGETCWEWRGRRDEDGYGRTSLGGKRNCGAHRMAWLLSNGEVPLGMCVLHSCDNPGCVNPDHLFLGTIADNNHDRAVKGRSADMRGHRSPKAKLTREQALEIKRRRLVGETTVALAREFYIHHGTVSRIVKAQTWGELS